MLIIRCKEEIADLEDVSNIRDKIMAQAKEGVILLDSCFEVVVAPDDVDIKIVNGTEENDEKVFL